MSASGKMDVKTLADLELQLLKKKKLRDQVQLSKLPDKGAKLNEAIQNLIDEISKLKLLKSSSLDETHETKVDDDSALLKNVNKVSKENGNAEPKSHVILESKKNTEARDNSTDVIKPATDFSSPSFRTYRDPSVKPKGIKLMDAPLLNPDQIIKKSSTMMLGSIWTRDFSSEGKKAIESIYESLKTCPTDYEEEISPINLETQLLTHQKTALRWLVWRETQDVPGGIFADDMGLGKTLSLISLILKDNEKQLNLCAKDNFNGTLIICPPALVHYWNLEIVKHCKEDSLKVSMYHGPDRKSDFYKYDVVITTYNLIQIEAKRKDSVLFSTKWNRIILDEAHVIKNYKSKTAQSVLMLKSVKKWAVTGTPIHNDLKDLYCLVKFLKIDPFDNLKIWEKFIEDQSDYSIERRNALIKGILLRRCKNDTDKSGKQLIPLPKKHIKHYKIDLTNEEKIIYDNISNKLRDHVSGHVVKKHVQSNKKSPCAVNSKKSDGKFLSYLLKLQQSCNHLSLLTTKDSDLNSLEFNLTHDFELLNIEENSSNSNVDVSLSFISEKNFEVTDLSSKVKRILSKVKRILCKGDITDKCVIVSQWVTMLNIIGHHLQTENIKYHTIAGSTKAEDRVIVSEDFNTNEKGPRVLLLSLKAGGVGLNLIGGNHLFLVDMHWNPALENQACDRVHRVGQTRDVFIYKFICSNTIEEKIFELQNEKRLLADNVLNGAKHVSTNITLEDLKCLFRK